MVSLLPIIDQSNFGMGSIFCTSRKKASRGYYKKRLAENRTRVHASEDLPFRPKMYYLLYPKEYIPQYFTPETRRFMRLAPRAPRRPDQPGPWSQLVRGC